MTSLIALAMVMKAPARIQESSGTCLGFVSSNLAKGPDNFFTYYRFAAKRLIFQKGDVLVYDIFIDPKSPELKGGIDVDLNGALSMREHHLPDQNGIDSHGDGVLQPAAGKWYKRRIDVGSLSGLEAVSWNLVFEGDAVGQYAQFVDDVHVERADGSRVDIYEGGPPDRPAMMGDNGYSSQPFLVDVPRADVEPGKVDEAIKEVQEIGTRVNTLNDMRRGVELVQQAISDEKVAGDAFKALAAAEAAAHSSKEVFAKQYDALQKQLLAVSPVIKQYRGDMVGYAHTDVQWLWEWPEARQAVYVTWRQALKFMDQYPDFSFSQSTTGYYRAMEETYPELFKQVQKRVKEGRWELVGGRICEADENLLSPEAHAMHFLYGQRYFRERFGKIATVGWEPDTFGHTAQMPQILKLGGCDSYYFCRAGKGEPLFWWEALDGSQVLTFDQVAAGAWYNGPLDENTPHELINWKKKTGQKEMMWVYGVGNHGGGPTKENIQTGQKIQHAPYEPSAKFTTATQFFKDMRSKDLSHLPTLQTELNPTFDGCYTSQARMKLLNDQAEAATTSAESVAAAASLFGFKYPGVEFRQNWETIGFNQHHDTICGSSFHWAYLKTIPELEGVVASDNVIARRALEHLTAHVNGSPNGSTVLVFNPTGWSRSGWVSAYLPMALFGGEQPDVNAFVAIGPDGKSIPVQVTDPVTGAAKFYASTPSFGYSLYVLKPGAKPAAIATKPRTGLENDLMKVDFDWQRGCIKSIVDKRTGKELAGRNGLGLLENHLEAPNPDAWTLNSIVGVSPIPVTSSTAYAKAGDTTVAFSYEFKDPAGNLSKIHQTFRLSPESDHVDVTVDCDWQAMGNTGKPSPLLRAAFDVAAENPVAEYQVPFGAITRPADGKEMPAQSWVDVSGKDAGVTIVEEGKHGFSFTGSTMRMSLIRSYDHPDFEPNRGNQSWSYQIVPHSGDWKSADGARRAAELAQPLMTIVVPPEAKGGAPASWSAVSFGASSVVPTCLKKAEDDNDLIVRVYESLGSATTAKLGTDDSIKAASLVNFLEDPLGGLTSINKSVSVSFKPFEIKTVKVRVVR